MGTTAPQLTMQATPEDYSGIKMQPQIWEVPLEVSLELNLLNPVEDYLEVNLPRQVAVCSETQITTMLDLWGQVLVDYLVPSLLLGVYLETSNNNNNHKLEA